MSFVEYIQSLPHFILIIYFFVTGSIFGSFANVIIYRTLRMIREEEEKEQEEGGVSKEEEENKKNTEELSSLPLSENGLESQDINKQNSISSEDMKTHSEADKSLQNFTPLSLKDRFMDRLLQHFEFFYCLFLFCIKRPFQSVYRRFLFFVKILGDGSGNDKEVTSFPHILIFRIIKPFKAVWRACLVKNISQALNLKDDGTTLSHSVEKEEAFPLDLMGHSRCPHCNYKIPFYLNVPIFSWFFLRGRCRNCKSGIAFRYPLVEFLMACLFTGLFILVGWKWFLLEALIFVFGLVVVSFIDWERMILPSFFTLPGIYLGLAGGYLNPERAFSSSLIGWFIGGFILWLAGYLYFKVRHQEGMGDGDVSLMGWIGAVLGWQSISFILICSCLLGVVFGSWSILRNKKDTRTPFPFGPCLAVGAVCYLFLQFLAPDILRIFSPL
ncbi:MAG: A24 family peptidase [Bdellovibrionales bacterium]|nr:A24 family peptidase [Bdellovibrionales bacterium]